MTAFRSTLWLVLGAALAAQAPVAPEPPAVDHHQHLFDAATGALSGRKETMTAEELVTVLDRAGIGRAAVLSAAYQFGNPNRPPVENEYEKVKAENDWTSRQVAGFPGRLVGFCGFNPLADYALTELERCAKDPGLRTGIKLHFGNSDVDLGNAEHVEKLRRVFHAANDRHMAIVTHVRSSVTKKRPYGAAQARTFLTTLVPAAPDVTIQIAHLTGAGGYEDPSVDEALSVFAEAAARHDRRMANVYFDVSGVVTPRLTPGKFALVASRIRQLGVERVLYGSDTAPGSAFGPREAWAAFRTLPLSDGEFRTIARNVAPYMK